LLADAKVDVISWIGTSASWLGFERDEALVLRIRESTGIKACTACSAFGICSGNPASNAWTGHALYKRCAREDRGSLGRRRVQL
jgi:hypothetical protein